jgi:hypothetical protein
MRPTRLVHHGWDAAHSIRLQSRDLPLRFGKCFAVQRAISLSTGARSSPFRVRE